VTAQILDRGLICFRIGDPDGQYPIFDGTGSTIAPGRWNTAGSPMVYASEHYSTGLLETLVHGSGALPPNQHFITITIPRGLNIRSVLPGLDARLGQRAGNRQQSIRRSLELRSLVLIVPSIVARVERNALINPGHPEVRHVTTTLHEPVFLESKVV
jgi:RES domain-containing protein